MTARNDALKARLKELRWSSSSRQLNAVLNTHKYYEQTIAELPTLYIVTPTFKRPTQMADMTRLRQQLWNLPKVHWIVIEDAENTTQKITDFLHFSHIPFTHLNELTPKNLSQVKINLHTHFRHKGAAQRNAAVAWMREHSYKIDPNGVVYFADDDNSYHLRLFHDMRFTKTVSIWPVAFIGGLVYERPIVRHGKVTSFNTTFN